MKKTISFTLVLAILASSYIPAVSEAVSTSFQFNRNLKQGDTVDPDVKYLQQILNSRPETAVATTGSGSNQQLSSYFGAKTKAAVIKFQNLYKTEILDPAGLTVPNGAVGPLTRKKLNEVLGTLPSTQFTYIPYGSKGDSNVSSSISNNRVLDGNSSGSVTTTVFPAPATQKSSSNNLPDGYTKISSLSTYKAVPGQVVSIFGQGFADESNILYVGAINVGAFNSLDKGTRITFTVPKVAQSGLYQIAINNYFGTINSGTITLAIESDTPSVTSASNSTSTTTIVNNGHTAVTGISPKTSQNINDVITLSGFNFTSQNTIQSNLGNFTVSSLDGKTIQFLAGSLPFYQKALDLYKGKSVNVLIKVSNENGVSEQVTLVLQFPNSSNPTINSNAQVSDSSTLVPYSSQGPTAEGNTPADTSLANYVSSFKGDTTPSSQSNSSAANTASDQTVATSTSDSGLAYGAAAIAAAVALGTAHNATALAAAPFFGGKITAVLPCTCTGGSLLLTIFDYTQHRPMYLMYVPGISSLKANYQLRPGVSTLGGFTRVTSMCWMIGPTVCNLYSYAEGTVDFIRGVGTSGI